MARMAAPGAYKEPRVSRLAWGVGGLCAIVLVVVAYASANLHVWVTVCLLAIPSLIWLANRAGWLVAGILTLLSIGGITSLGALVAPGLPGSIGDITIFAAAVCAVVAVVALVREARVQRISVGGISALAASCFGALVWTVSVLTAGGGAIVWSMATDSPSYINFARQMLNSGGQLLVDAPSPVPLPVIILAQSMEPARRGLPTTMYGASDMSSYALTWGVIIGLSCVLVGLTSSALVPRRFGIVRIVLSAVGSLIPLSAYVSGFAMTYGFYNASLTLVLLVLAWYFFIRTESKPILAIVGLGIAATLVAITWTPVSFPVFALIGAAIIRDFKILQLSNRLQRIGTASLYLVLVFIISATILPFFEKNPSVFGASGLIGEVARTPIIVTAILVTFLAVIRWRATYGFGTIVFVGALFTALKIGLLQLQSSDDPWSYYPVKMIWIIGIICIVLFFTLLGEHIGRFHRPAIRITAVVTSVLLLFGALNVAKLYTNETTGHLSLDRKSGLAYVTSGEAIYTGDSFYKAVEKYTSYNGPRILWNYKLNIGNYHDIGWFVDRWLLLLNASLGKTRAEIDTISSPANRLDMTDIDLLCTLVKTMGPSAGVITNDETLPTQVQEKCPEVVDRISIEATN